MNTATIQELRQDNSDRGAAGYYPGPWSGEDGEEKARVPMGNYMQSAVFPCPGWDRDFYWLGLDRLSRIAVA